MSKATNSFGLQEPRPNWFRAEVKDPLTGKNLVFQGRDPVFVAAQRDKIRQLTKELSSGLITPQEVHAQRARVVGGAMTVERAVLTYLESAKESSKALGQSAWKVRIKPTLGCLNVAELTKSRMEKWAQDELQSGIKKRTLRNAWSVLRAAVKLAIADGLLSNEPWSDFGVRVPEDDLVETETTRTVQEFQALVMAAKERDERLMRAPGGPRWSCLWIKIVVGVELALRQGELAALGWDDFSWRDGAVVKIRHQVKRNWKVKHPEWDRPRDEVKGRRVWELPLSNDLVLVLAIQKKALERLGWYRPNGPVFPAKNGDWHRVPRAVNEAVFREVFVAAIPGADKKLIKPHGLRHSGASLGVKATGGDLARVKRLTRHAGMKQLYKYLHPCIRGGEHPLPSIFGAQTNPPALALPEKEESLALPTYLPGDLKLEVPVEIVDADVEDALSTLRALPRVASAVVDDDCLAAAEDEPVEEDESSAEVSEEEWLEQQKAAFRAKKVASVRRAHAKKAGRQILELKTVWAKWQAEGARGVPREIQDEANRAYARAYVVARRAGKTGRLVLQSACLSWDALAARVFDAEPKSAQIEALRAVNEVTMPLQKGARIVLPCEAVAVRKGRAARRGYFAIWTREAMRLAKRYGQGKPVRQDPTMAEIGS